ncbi:MAG: hypothetical protein LBF59_00055 [Prevotellaceae bacterium]|jgi:hypothetical protein|nr:hypothetical protein [Prevotellaceae bacterium]
MLSKFDALDNPHNNTIIIYVETQYFASLQIDVLDLAYVVAFFAVKVFDDAGL